MVRVDDIKDVAFILHFSIWRQNRGKVRKANLTSAKAPSETCSHDSRTDSLVVFKARN